MTTILSLLPLLLVIALLASGRVGALIAGLAGLAATLAVSAPGAGQRPERRPGAVAALCRREVPAGLWLAWQVIAIIATGIFFHRCQQARAPQPARRARIEATPRRLWSVCFLLAPFAESVTGFGVGYIIALAALRRLGLGGLPTLLLGLYSQSLVPWGALAIGTTVGATLAGLTPNELGLGSALLQVPIHLLYLLLYWRFAREAGLPVPLAQKLDDVAWTALLLALVWLANLPQRRRDRRRRADRLRCSRCASGATSGPGLADARAALRASRALRRAHRSRCAPRGWCRRCAIS